MTSSVRVCHATCQEVVKTGQAHHILAYDSVSEDACFGGALES